MPYLSDMFIAMPCRCRGILHSRSRRAWHSILALIFVTSALWCLEGTVAPLSLGDESTPAGAREAIVSIPRLTDDPTLEDFLDMKPDIKFRGQLAQVSGFVQREPSDGSPATERTEVYLGYNDRNLYVIFVCFDSDPHRIHAHMTRRENIFQADDDAVEIMLDTFSDHLHAYSFIANPFGIQYDAIFSEGRNDSGGSDTQNFDGSFDTTWYSRGKLTTEGYVVWMAVPFKSLRFPRKPTERWGVILNRTIARKSENDFWPYLSSRVQGRLNQEAVMEGLEHISPGRNLQFIPYAISRSFRSLDLSDPTNPKYAQSAFQGRVGLDSKFVLKDSVVFDVTVNPDFSQVESDQPQLTLNQRFEVFFPERRPFFQENANFFETPSPLVFTRRIADPEFGLRLTGKFGREALGFLASDDRAPGETVSRNDPHFGARAHIVAARLTREISNQSKLGAIYTDREFADTFNRVAGVDGRFKFGTNWLASLQAVASFTRNLDGAHSVGSGYRGIVNRTGRQLNYALNYTDYSKDFREQIGFIPRVDIRDVAQFISYDWRPEAKHLVSIGPQISAERIWDHKGQLLDDRYYADLHLVFRHETVLDIGPFEFHNQRLRPQDFAGLVRNVEFPARFGSVALTSAVSSQLKLSVLYKRGRDVNVLPAKGQFPSLSRFEELNATISVRPKSALQVDSTYLLERLRDMNKGHSVFTNHIVRSEWNWQFTPELGLRFIGQYNSVLSNGAFSSVVPAKEFNADFLFTYLVHPGTALYVGYNTNLANIDRRLIPFNGDLLRVADKFVNDGRQLFVKLSYQFRF